MSASPGGEKGCSLPRPPLIHKVGGKRKEGEKGKMPVLCRCQKRGRGKEERSLSSPSGFGAKRMEEREEEKGNRKRDRELARNRRGH